MIPIKQQIEVIDVLTKQASEAVYDLRVLELLETRELALQSLFRDLRATSHLVGTFPSRSFELFGGK